MEKSVSLILLRRSDLCTKNTLHNKTFIPIGVARVDMDLHSCMVSGKHRMLSIFRITSGRVLTIVTKKQSELVRTVPKHVAKSFTTMILNIPCTACGRGGACGRGSAC